MELGIWPAEYALGEKYLAMLYLAEGYDIEYIRVQLKIYVDGNYISDMQRYQKRGERASILWGAGAGTSSGANNALFGTPIDRSKANTDRMHEITVSMAKDTGKRDRETNAYNPAVVPLYALKNPDGTYVLPSGGRTSHKEQARVYTDRAEAEAHCLSRQAIVEV